MVSAMKDIGRVAILGGRRIPFARRNTAYRNSTNQEMLTAALSSLVNKFDLQGARLGEVVGGAVIKNSRENITRESVMGSGLSRQTPAYDLQQACATSLQSVVVVANKIALGQVESGIACGVDSTSDVPIQISEGLRRIILDSLAARDSLAKLQIWSRFRPTMLLPAEAEGREPRTGLTMGEHCELMVKQWQISQQEQDELSLASHLNGCAAYERGFYEDLVTPFKGLDRDNNLRADTSLERLAKLKPAFDRSSAGTLTAGNSTPFTDGASSLLLASESWAAERGHSPLAWFIDAETAAVDYIDGKEGLLMAPAHAVARLLARHKMQLKDFDFYEIHEAFAGQVLCTLKAWESSDYCRERLGLDSALGSIDRSKLNVNGGSVALGHPFAATGTRIVAGAAKQLNDFTSRTKRPGRTLVTACAAGGTGVAMILAS
jgi:acetyl-CoA C-acetyltransferase